MKEIRNISIFFFFVFCYLFRGSLEVFWIQILNTNINLETNDVINQNLKQELEEMQQKFQITIPEEKIEYSKVIYRDPTHFFDTITILKGKEEGLSKNAPVMDGKYLIGIIDEVESHSSIVKLLTNSSTNLSVKVNDAYGILKTNKEKECWIEDFSKNILVEEGAEVKTSGLTEIPGNILIGTVDKIELSELGTIQRMKVKRAIDIEQINYVSILKKEIIK